MAQGTRQKATVLWFLIDGSSQSRNSWIVFLSTSEHMLAQVIAQVHLKTRQHADMGEALS